ncbi:MAG: geranyl transferase [Campylobacteraceae bacterium 4484_4]|nr:MAG: geranyl transferase [Campylobacteraceae bacterium 4484_4]
MESKNEKLLHTFETFLQQHLPEVESFHPHYQNALKEMFEAGGKRFRPLLLLGVVDAYAPLMIPSAMYAAAAVEMLHTYSLIHDDLPTFDDAELRRGVPTLHKRYDEVVATLAGDALNTYSFEMIADAPLAADTKVKLIKILAQNGGAKGMVLGQAIDCFFENQKLTLEELTFLHLHKTAKLIAASLKMGGIIVDLPRKELDLLYEIGLKIGLLFQVQDDIIDATQTSEVAGKPTGNDSIKNSFTNLLGVEGAKAEKEKLLEESREMIASLDSSLQSRLSDLINRYF